MRTIENRWKRLKTVEIGWQQVKAGETGEKGSNWVNTSKKGQKGSNRSQWVKTAKNGWKWVNMVPNASKQFKTGKKWKIGKKGFETTIPRETGRWKETFQQKCMQWHNNNTRHSTEIPTYRLNRPRGQFSDNPEGIPRALRTNIRLKDNLVSSIGYWSFLHTLSDAKCLGPADAAEAAVLVFLACHHLVDSAVGSLQDAQVGGLESNGSGTYTSEVGCAGPKVSTKK